MYILSFYKVVFPKWHVGNMYFKWFLLQALLKISTYKNLPSPIALVFRIWNALRFQN